VTASPTSYIIQIYMLMYDTHTWLYWKNKSDLNWSLAIYFFNDGFWLQVSKGSHRFYPHEITWVLYSASFSLIMQIKLNGFC